jgi:hypothetical protein
VRDDEIGQEALPNHTRAPARLQGVEQPRKLALDASGASPASPP